MVMQNIEQRKDGSAKYRAEDGSAKYRAEDGSSKCLWKAQRKVEVSAEDIRFQAGQSTTNAKFCASLDEWLEV